MVRVSPLQLGKTERRLRASTKSSTCPEPDRGAEELIPVVSQEGLKRSSRTFRRSKLPAALVLDFIDYRLDSEPKYSIKKCKERDVTYAAPLRVKARLLNKETGEVKEQEIFMGDFPLMTDSGTFIINGAERVIVSQLVRSPGVYFGKSYDKTGKELFTATLNPNRGAWLEYETDANDVFYVRIDQNARSL